jgi:hypothetical protein
MHIHAVRTAIYPSSLHLQETGRGGLADAALADGSSWQCPQCGGVVPQQRRQVHIDAWCPQSSSSHLQSGEDMMQ